MNELLVFTALPRLSRVPEDCDTSQPIVLKLNYAMSSPDPVGKVAMVLEYEVVDDDGDVTPAAVTATKVDVIDPPDSAQVLDMFSGVNLKIDAANLGGAGRNINCKLYRDADVGGDTHTGNFRVLNVWLVYTKAAN